VEGHEEQLGLLLEVGLLPILLEDLLGVEGVRTAQGKGGGIRKEVF